MRQLVLAIVLVAAGASQVLSQATERAELSPEGEARRAAHRYLLGEYAHDNRTVFKGEGTTKVLDEIVISTIRHEVAGDFVIDLPSGSQRVASMFRYLILRGEGLDNVEGLVMLPYSPNSNMSVSTRQSGIYRVKVPAMPIPTSSMPPMQIRSRCKPGTKAIVTEIAFNSQGKLSTTFDDIPYRNLGAEFPRENVEVKVDLQNELSIAGHVDLEREKFCRYYAAPGHVDGSFERWAAERNFLPGRQIMKLQPALVVGYSKNQPKLTETAPRSGKADLSFFNRYHNAGPSSHAIEKFRDIKYAMCFNDYPEFMSVKQVGRGTPLVDHFDDAAELAAAYVADQIQDGGRTATWWEVKNEATIKSEWDYHWKKEYDSWALMADFHNRVADAVHKRAPNTQVGGPSSAWMQLQAADFGLYRNQARFMDLTKDHVDFYSHHFYEDFGTLGALERREGKYTNYMLGRLEAILDMLRAHMHETNNVKPILVTECGSLQPGRGASDYWLRIRSHSAYMHKLMQRPEQVDLVVPFAFMSIPWNPKSGDAAFIPKEGKRNNSPLADCEPTPVRYLFELWRDFDGRRLPVSFDRQWLDVTAVHRGNQLQFALTNMGGRRLSIDFAAVVGVLPVDSVSQRRLYYVDGNIKFEDAVSYESAKDIAVDVEETTIVTIKLKAPVQTDGTINREAWYAKGTAVKSDIAAERGFKISVDDHESVQAARLVIGVHRDGGLNSSLQGQINGKPFVSEAEWATEINNLFAPIEIKVPLSTLASSNHVRIDPMPGLTITSVHIVTDRCVTNSDM